MNAQHAIERKRRGRRCGERRRAGGVGLRGRQRADVFRDLVQLGLEVGLERSEPRFRALEPAQRQVGGGDARLAERRGLIAQLPGRLFVHAAERLPLVLDRALELTQPLDAVLLEAVLDRVPLVEPFFDFVDGVRVAPIGFGPAAEDFGAAFGQLVETLLQRHQMVWILRQRRHHT